MIALIVTRGFGNGAFDGSIKDIVTRGYSIGEQVIIDDIDGDITIQSQTPVYTVDIDASY